MVPPSSQGLLHECLFQSADRLGGRTAIVDEFGQRTYQELLEDALRVANLLQGGGLQPGDRVLLCLDNTAQCAAAIFGTLIAGGVFVMVSPQTRSERLRFVLEDSDATFLLAEGHAGEMVMEAVSGLGRPVSVFLARASGNTTFPGLEEAQAASDAKPPPTATRPTDLAALAYTSGTTGRPKGVMLSHQALVFVTGSIAEYLRVDEDDRILVVLPLVFTYGLSQLLVAARVGGTLLLERSFAFPGRTLERMHTERATVFAAVPTVYATLIGMQHSRTYDSVRCLANAAAALPPAHHDELRRLFPNARLYRMYGMTECVRVSYLDPELVDSKPTSVGRAIPGTEVLVLDDQDRPVAPGVTGTLHVRGPHLLSGYWKDPALTEQKLKPGPRPGERMLRTEDKFTIDEDGLLYFVGRSDDIIKTRGEKVSPAEVENVLQALHGVRQAAVVGVPDDLLGEAILAYVTLEDGAQLTQDDILRFTRSRLENYMVPREVILLDELPQTESGKVRKRSLVDGSLHRVEGAGTA